MESVIGFIISWLPMFAIYGILSISLNLEIGYTGMANFGKVAFYAIGAYLSAALTISVMLSLVGKNVHKALEVADRAYVLVSGRIVREAEPKTLLEEGVEKLFFQTT